ncbi:alcohol dehydrogenase [Serratia marcescens]|uniref:zinc-binding dehydrogenase n=1 Tax=Serratia TaxID=613 RepID=UPI0007C64FC3|nr:MULTISPECIES: zinc-binding dehydrogenase [Serratia]AOE99358.1 alcohol dehydrogenase [Serratia surfactantfaciens]MTD05416.1 zinc-binding dehydrogenase [Serratia sp. YC16]BEM87447.1 alcohol dehydrogenase [Serratia marcescens]BEO37636.1 alcohol dehydrogenase [Serratia marcescens]
MRIAIHDSLGQPEQVIRIEQTSRPKPKAGEVLLQMVLSPIHNHDLMQISGTYGIKPELPARAGTEALGRVIEVGADVKHLKVGQRVAVSGAIGTWADAFVAPAATLLPVPDDISDELAAQLLVMPSSATVVLDDLGVKSGQWMILSAAAGAVGKNLALLAASRQIRVIGLVNQEHQVQELKELGVDVVENTEIEGWQSRIKAALNGEPLLFGLDSVAGKLTGEMLSIMNDNATLVVFGAMSNQPLYIDYQDVIFKQAIIRGFWGLRKFAALSDEYRSRMISEIITLAQKDGLNLPVAAVYDLGDIAKAIGTKHAPGKVLLRGSDIER